MNIRIRPSMFLMLASLILTAEVHADPLSSEVEAFFANSRRRPATASESRHIANLDGCTAFYVANTTGQNLLISARHCVGYDAAKWCETGRIRNASDDDTRACIAVVATDRVHDIFLFEVGGERRLGGLTLGARVPGPGTRLRMIGYPADPRANRALTVTENCWVHSSDVANPFVGSDYWDLGLRDRAYSHNCSTYGGNSGGPMIVEGTDVVVGLPFTYFQDQFDQRPPSDSARGARMDGFVAAFGRILNAAGVRLSRHVTSRGSTSYLRRGVYRSNGMDCPFRLIPRYDSGARVTRLDVLFCQASSYATYVCDAEACSYQGSRIIPLPEGRFRYESPTGASYVFRRD